MNSLEWRMNIGLKPRLRVDETGVGNFVKTPSPYGWCILTPVF
jgi:hypothetical protein